MSRKTYEERENEIIDVAMRLFYTRTYEQTTIQDIIDTIGIAKGTFYHYFKSKDELLDAIMQRKVMQASEDAVNQIAFIEGNALQKIYVLFNEFALFDLRNREFFMEILEPIFSTDNIRLLHEIREAGVQHITPMLAQIIHQGIEEGVFSTPYPDEIAHIILNMQADMVMRMGKIILHLRDDPALPEKVKREIRIHEHCVEQLLNAKPGKLRLFDLTIIDQFIQGDT